MIWCGECGYKGKGLYLENEVYCPYCKATGNDIVVLPIDNNIRNLTDEETDIYNSWIEAEAEAIGEVSLLQGGLKMTIYEKWQSEKYSIGCKIWDARCPNCHGLVESIVPISSNYRFCPYCGFDMKSDVEVLNRRTENE